MLSIEPLNVLDSLLLLGAANTIFAEFSLYFLQLQLGVEELLIVGFVLAGGRAAATGGI